MTDLKIINVVGCRPNFIKIAPLMAEMTRHPDFSPLLVHTGQHYDDLMSDVFFRDLRIPRADVSLNVGSGSMARQLSIIMQRFEPVLLETKPDLVLVVGDVNSTFACGLTAVTLGFPVAHVEAGLRSFDREMPEEINRVLTDAISDFLFASEPSAVENLLREGKPPEQIYFVGNVIIDSLLRNADVIDQSNVLYRLGLKPKAYAMVTLHRRSNVDDPGPLGRVVTALEAIQGHIPLVFPAHPHTVQRLELFGYLPRLASLPGVQIVEPLGYVDCAKVIKESQFVLTDSGGVQEETTVLGVPCLTLRENTERPVTLTEGTNRLVGTRVENIVEEGLKLLYGSPTRGRIPAKWDGLASQRIVQALESECGRIKQLHRSVRKREKWQEMLKPA